MSPGKRYTGLTIDRSSRRSITIVPPQTDSDPLQAELIATDDTRVVVDDLDAYIHDPITQQRKRDTVREKVRIQRAARAARGNGL